MAIDCRAALERLLEAEPAALRAEDDAELAAHSSAEDDAELAAHLRACPRCAALAAGLLAETTLLARALDEERPATPVDAALRELRARRDRPERWRGAGRDRRGLSPGAWRWAVPLAAAAGLAGLFLLRPSVVRREVVPTGPVAVRPETPPLVDPPAGVNVMVLETAEPDVTIIWFY